MTVEVILPVIQLRGIHEACLHALLGERAAAGGAQRPANRKQKTLQTPSPPPEDTVQVEDIVTRVTVTPGETLNDNTNPTLQTVEEVEHSQGVDCPLFSEGKCPFGISGKRGGECTGVHRKRCTLFLRWGNKNVKGCNLPDCPKLHPSVCPASLDLLCTDQNCLHKLHVQKCKRRAVSDSDRPNRTKIKSVKKKQTGNQFRGNQYSRGLNQERTRPGVAGGCSCRSGSGNSGSQPVTVNRGNASTAATGNRSASSAGQGDQPFSEQAQQSRCSSDTAGHRPCCTAGREPSPAPVPCMNSQQHESQPVGFQVPTVQPMLEAWLENTKKEMAQKQEIMLQMLRMEMMQARAPMLGRGAYGLHPSY